MALKIESPFGRPPLEERIALRQAGQRTAADGGQYFDHPTAKYVFVAGLVLTVLVHVILGVLFAIHGF